VFVIASHFHPSLIFEFKSWSLPLKWSLVRNFTRVGSTLAHKYKTSMEATDSGEHSKGYNGAKIITVVKKL
jgi:hypothetical protein